MSERFIFTGKGFAWNFVTFLEEPVIFQELFLTLSI